MEHRIPKCWWSAFGALLLRAGRFVWVCLSIRRPSGRLSNPSTKVDRRPTPCKRSCKHQCLTSPRVRTPAAVMPYLSLMPLQKLAGLRGKC